MWARIRKKGFIVKNLYGLLPHSSPAVVFFDVGIQASGI